MTLARSVCIPESCNPAFGLQALPTPVLSPVTAGSVVLQSRIRAAGSSDYNFSPEMLVTLWLQSRIRAAGSSDYTW